MIHATIAQSDCVTAYGWGFDALWNGVMSGKTAIRAADRFVENGFISNQAAMVPELDVRRDGSRAMAMLERSLAPLIGRLDPQTPLILATTVGEVEYVERAVIGDRSSVGTDARPLVLLERIKKLLALRGSATVISSACASSTAALTRAASIVRRGGAKNVLVVSVDAISEFVYSGFSTLMSLCETPARPFDAQRCGLTLGEAAAWAVVSADESSDGAAILGWGNTTDAVHMTAPDRNAGGLSRAIAKACAMSGCSADDIALIAAHGTATVYSDAMEMVAFRGTLKRPRPTFSIKGAIGHTLAAAGLVQILVTQRAMRERVVPPTVGLQNADESAAGWARGTLAKLDAAPTALSTNSGFGGVNTAILLGSALAWHVRPARVSGSSMAETPMPRKQSSPRGGGRS